MYEDFFGLNDLPFRLTPDPRYLFLSPKHAEALAHLRLGLTESSGFVCITGDIGTGKTTLLRTFLAELGPDVSAAYVFNPALSARELLQRINHELGVPDGGQRDGAGRRAQRASPRAAAGRDGCRSSSSTRRRRCRSTLLEQLRLLSNLETTTEKLLRLVLVGQPQLRDAARRSRARAAEPAHHAPLAHRPARRCDETVAYVQPSPRGGERRPGDAALHALGALALVHRYAKGVPRLVNMIAHRSLLAAFVAREREVTGAIVRRAYREIEAVPLRPARCPRGGSAGPPRRSLARRRHRQLGVPRARRALAHRAHRRAVAPAAQPSRRAGRAARGAGERPPRRALAVAARPNAHVAAGISSASSPPYDAARERARRRRGRARRLAGGAARGRRARRRPTTCRASRGGAASRRCRSPAT